MTAAVLTLADLAAHTCHVATSIETRPDLMLAMLAAWLDPAPIYYDTTDDDTWGDESPYYTLLIMRACYPERYIETAQQLQQGTGILTVAQDFLDFINEDLGLEYWDWENLGYGIMPEGLGLSLGWVKPDAETLQRYQVVANAFNVPTINDLTEHHERLAVVLLRSLLHQGTIYEDLYWLLSFIFGLTGNSVLDTNEELLREFEPLPWTPENVAFMREMHWEILTLLPRINRALSILEHNPTVFHALQNNLRWLAQKARHFNQDWEGNHGLYRYAVDHPAPDGAHLNPLAIAWPDPA